MTRNDTTTAIVAKRVDQGPISVDEITDLADAAGYTVIDSFTQRRSEDPATYLGRGKVEQIVDRVEDRDVDAVIVDGELTATQARSLMDVLPAGVEVFDRYRLILDIFTEQASDRRAQLQIERIKLQYELDWFASIADESPLTRAAEKGSRRYQLQDRIDTVEQELASLPDVAQTHRQRRQEAGFDLVTLAGYTNAGKSTLLHRLADELSLETAETTHADLDAVAAIEDRLFKTLETTTRRATLRGRPVLCTDTVGFISDLPHRMVASFSETLSEAAVADVVVLVTEASDDLATFEQRLDVAQSVLTGQGVDRTDVVAALNKIDLVDGETVAARREQLSDRFDTVVHLSAQTGQNLDLLVDRIYEKLPTADARLELPYGDETMALVSDAYDRARVCDIDYRERTITIEIEGRPSVIETFEATTSTLGGTACQRSSS